MPGRMAQQVKVLFMQPEGLSSLPGIYNTKLFFSHHTCAMAHSTYVHMYVYTYTSIDYNLLSIIFKWACISNLLLSCVSVIYQYHVDFNTIIQ